MGDLYDFFALGGGLIKLAQDGGDFGDEVRLWNGPDGEQVVEALRGMLAHQIDVNLGYLRDEWAKVDPRLLNLVEDFQPREWAKVAGELAAQLAMLAQLSSYPCEGDDDDSEPEPAPDPEGSTHA